MIPLVLYDIYTRMFACRRGCLRFFFQEDAPRKTLIVELPAPAHPWVYISAIWDNDDEDDVTEMVENVVMPDEVLTPARLLEITEFESEEEVTGIDSITSTRKLLRWSYMDSKTFEVREITSEGLVNVVNPKSD